MRYSPGMGVGSFFRMDLDPAWEGTARRYYPYSNPSVLQNKKLSSQIEDESLSSAVPPQFTRSPVHSLQPDNGLCRTVLLVFNRYSGYLFPDFLRSTRQATSGLGSAGVLSFSPSLSGPYKRTAPAGLIITEKREMRSEK